MKQRRLLSILLIIMLIVLNITGVYADNDITASLEEADHSVGLNAFEDSFIPDDFFENSTSIAPLATYYESESNNTMATADTIYSGQDMKGKITPSGDVDFFVLRNASGGTINFWIETTSSSATPYYNYSVYNSAGTLIGASSNARKLVVYDQTGGTYYIRVSSTVSSSTIQYTVRAKVYPYTAYIMQGNTKDALDCETIYYDLQDNNYSSTSIGWTLGNTGQAYITPVTTSEFVNAKNYTVAYYSGHGARSPNNPTINVRTNNSSTEVYIPGQTETISIASALNVSGTQWATTCAWQKNDPIRVLILASCYQLDSNCISTYAKIMKASGIRAIAGYHEQAPSYGDHTIAASFINFAESGESIKSSWRQANNGQNWAVLVYEDGANQYYRLPGFPGNTYSAPSSSTPIYRYANFIDNTGNTGQPVSTSASNASAIPTTLVFEDISENDTENILYRDSVGTAVNENETVQIAENEAEERITEADLQNAICVESSVIKELVDTEIGIVDGTATTIEKGYTYYDTYNGIKLRDSFISISVDADGVTGIVDSWKERTISAIPASMVTRENMISASAASEVALQHAESFNYADIEPEVNGDLSYVPVGDNVYQLCYEITTTDGIVFISVLDGAIIEPAI